jgi:orotidine-5'-phosphate decarboxylase
MPPHLAQAAYEHFGAGFDAISELFFVFNRGVIDAVAPYAVAVKPNVAFYERYGHHGLHAYERTIRYARDCGLLIIGDVKRGDGGDTGDAYADGHIGEVPFWGSDANLLNLSRTVSPIRVDCATVNPYIGDDCIRRFVKPVRNHGTGIFVVDRTSFSPNSRVEELTVGGGLMVWQSVAKMIDGWGENTEGMSGYRNVGAVLGATKPEHASWMREALPNSWLLLPGYGQQGAGADAAVEAVNSDALGCLISTSRGVSYPYWNFKAESYLDGVDPQNFKSLVEAKAIAAREDINAALQRAGKCNF